MTCKHFAALAAIVNAYTEQSRSVGVEKLAHDLAQFCKEQNGNFDKGRFMQACGLSADGRLPEPTPR